MSLPILYAHPFSSYSQKVLIALYENDTQFTYRVLDGTPTAQEELAQLWPLKRFPTLVERGRTIVESSSIIDYLALHHPGPSRLIPADADAALEVRMLDRFFDNYVMTPMQNIVHNQLRPEAQRDPFGVAAARTMLETAYQWLDGRLAAAKTAWVAADEFSLADCAAAPSLFYADWAHEIDPRFSDLKAYRARLLARPSVARCVDEARPYRPYFPLPVPDRD
jgi:glutathione S-transferase